MADDLYEKDYYAWTKEQAAALRARRSGANAIDFDNLAEEVDDMGKSELWACESLIENILVHFLKIEFSPASEPAAHWRAEIRAFRQKLERKLSPSLRASVPPSLHELYKAAVLEAEAEFIKAKETPTEPLPQTCPYAWDDVLGRGEDWTPPSRAA